MKDQSDRCGRSPAHLVVEQATPSLANRQRAAACAGIALFTVRCPAIQKRTGLAAALLTFGINCLSQRARSVRVDGADNVKAIATAKRLFSLSNDDASKLLQSYPNLRIGTKAEADWRVEGLAGASLTAETEGPAE